MKKSVLSLIFLMLTSACHTMVIKNGPEASTHFQMEEWHHIGVFRLVEFSAPVDLNERCGGKGWDSVQTRTGPLQVLVRNLPYVSAAYSPEEVKITCKN